MHVPTSSLPVGPKGCYKGKALDCCGPSHGILCSLWYRCSYPYTCKGPSVSLLHCVYVKKWSDPFLLTESSISINRNTMRHCSHGYINCWCVSNNWGMTPMWLVLGYMIYIHRNIESTWLRLWEKHPLLLWELEGGTVVVLAFWPDSTPGTFPILYTLCT